MRSWLRYEYGADFMEIQAWRRLSGLLGYKRGAASTLATSLRLTAPRTQIETQRRPRLGYKRGAALTRIQGWRFPCHL